VTTTPGKRLLFVCGTPRSGTSALAQLLNTSPNVVLGIERYRALLVALCRSPPHSAGDPIRALFSKDRLLGAMRPEDTKPFPLAQKGDAEAKWNHATYVGDKVPFLYRHIESLARACPDARFVHIVRDPYQVAASWQRKADDPDDAWPKTNDAAAAVIRWNEGSPAHCAPAFSATGSRPCRTSGCLRCRTRPASTSR